MEEKEILQFMEWLPTKFEEFQNKSPQEIATSLNELYKTNEGKQTIETLINTFKQEKSQPKFEDGGKLEYLINLHKKGGKSKKVKSKRCKCGCAMKRVLEKGGIVEKCACGCKAK